MKALLSLISKFTLRISSFTMLVCICLRTSRISFYQCWTWPRPTKENQQFGSNRAARSASSGVPQHRTAGPFPWHWQAGSAANAAFRTRQETEAWSPTVIKNLLVLLAGVWISSLGPIPLWVITLCLPIYFLCNSKWIQYFPISALNGSAL